jgi:hypothetical protein
MFNTELNALCIQWIAGDARHCGIDGEDLSAINWPKIEQDQENGQAPGSLSLGDDGRIYWLCSEC